ncbi:MAG: trypsin-like peptidase domain-containing protein [Acidobacteria bacterium]|nr:trypsin-like peptidase domain-containing protein [Acidobacteriota bacterium]
MNVEYLKQNEVRKARGTGFFVFVEDQRLGANNGFAYLVTNRHIAEPEENGRRFQVVKVSLRLNLKAPVQGQESEERVIPLGGGLHWYFPADDSVDIAVLPFAPDIQKYDYSPIPMSTFATKDFIESHAIAEGDRVLFVGYFYQFPGLRKAEPIIREGVLAMMPEEKMETTLHKMGRLYLADVHVFGGNSGAPLFVNITTWRGRKITVSEYPYRLVGVVSGYFFEDVNFRLTVATTLEGKGQGNSGISIVVPVDELKALLESPALQRLRDAAVSRLKTKE